MENTSLVHPSTYFSDETCIKTQIDFKKCLSFCDMTHKSHKKHTNVRNGIPVYKFQKNQ